MNLKGCVMNLGLFCGEWESIRSRGCVLISPVKSR